MSVRRSMGVPPQPPQDNWRRLGDVASSIVDRIAHQNEGELHVAVAEYLEAALPPGVVWTTFPAGGGGKVRGANLKRAGLKPGWPDIQLVIPPHGRLVGIELKIKGREPSDIQDAVHEQLTQAGAAVAVCRSVDDVQAFLGPLVQLRGSLS